MKSILCFGDSNTWGYTPGTGERFDWRTRWTGTIQNLLGDRYRIIEDGLTGRTTSWDDPTWDNRNGRVVLPISLEIHSPLDLVVIALGVNDLKTRFNLSPFDIARGASKLVEVVLGWPPPVPLVLLISPHHVKEVEGFDNLTFQGAEAKSKELTRYYRYFAEMLGCDFLDAAEVVNPSAVDGVHWDAEGHQSFAVAVARKIKNMMNETQIQLDR